MTSPLEDGPGPTIEVEEIEWVESPATRWRRKPVPPTPHPTLPELVNDAVQEGKDYVDAQVELFKIKAQRTATKAAGAVAMFAVAIVFLLLVAWWTFHTGEVALALALPAWAASLIIWGVLLLLGILFALLGVVFVKRAQKDAPHLKEMVADDVATLKADFAEAKEEVKEGVDQ